MYRKHNLMLMAALMGVMSVGGTAIAASTAPEFPDDGKIRVRNVETGQVCEFDTVHQAADFHNHVEGRDSWELVKPVEAPASDAADEPHTLTDVIDYANAQAEAIMGLPATLVAQTAEPAAAPIAAPAADAATTTTEQPAA